MKSLNVFALVLFVSSFAKAGGGGGGGVLLNFVNAQSFSSEMIFHIKEEKEFTSIAHAQLVDGEWQVQKVELPKSLQQFDPEASEAIEKSREIGQWVPLYRDE
ncbi:MAG: hypothetical protein KF767_12830 [Bdellovibrionaceae bacterium]|nr:hypothetical protein [Pseudobdellovibrionaceae bacterium]